MIEFVLMVVIVGALCLVAWGVCEALGRIATHMRGSPDAAKAIVEHVFMPLFGEKKEPERKLPPGKAMVVRESSEEPSSDN